MKHNYIHNIRIRYQCHKRYAVRKKKMHTKLATKHKFARELVDGNVQKTHEMRIVNSQHPRHYNKN